MATVVTLPGAPAGTTLTYTLNNAFNGALAQSIANALAAASTGGGGGLVIGTVDGSGGFSKNTVAGSVGELEMTSLSGAAVNVTGAGSGWNYLINSPGNAGPDAVSGQKGLSIMGGDGNHTVSNADVVVLGDGNDVVNETDPTITYNVAVGNGSNTLVGGQHGTLAGGTGSNVFNLSGESGLGGNVVFSQGAASKDSILAGAGSDTINMLTPVSATVGGQVTGATGGDLTVNVGDGTGNTGRKDTISAGPVASVTVNNNRGRGMVLFGSKTGPTNVVDNAFATSTIRGQGGALSATIQGAGANLVYGSGGASVVWSSTASGGLMTPSDSAAGALNATISGAKVSGSTGNKGATIEFTSVSSGAFIFGGGSGVGSDLNVDDLGAGNTASAPNVASLNVTAAGSNGVFVGGSGKTNALVSGKGNQVYTQYATGDASETVTGSSNTIGIGNATFGGNLTVTGAGSGNTIVPLNSGSAVVNIVDGGTGEDVLGTYGTGPVNVTVSGTNDTIAAGPGVTQVNDEGATAPQILNLGGALTFVGGTGSATVQAFNFTGSSVVTTVFGGVGNSNITYADVSSAQGLFYQAGTGNDTLDATHSVKNDTLAAGPGNVTLTAGSGQTEFLFSKTIIEGVGSVGGTANLVTNFTVNGANSVNIGGGYASNSASVSAAGSSALLTLSDGTQITFAKTTTTQLNAAIVYT